MIEFRESMLNKAVDIVDHTKQNLCELEDLLYDLYEEEHDEYDEKPQMNDEPGDTYEAVVEGNDIEVNYRGRRGMRGGLRYRKAMRSGMRRNRMGRYSY